MIKFSMALVLLVSLSGCFFVPDGDRGPHDDHDHHGWSHDNGYDHHDGGPGDQRGGPY